MKMKFGAGHRFGFGEAALARSRHRARALALAIAFTLSGARGAGAVDWYTGEKTSDPDYAPSIVLDASGSFTSKQSDFGAVSVTAALDGNMVQTGFRARAEGIFGGYTYDATPLPGTKIKVNAVEEIGGAQIGYAWVSREWTFALFAGAQAMNTTLSWNDPNNPTKGLHIGGKIAGEFYGTPTKNTMLSGYASYATGTNEYYSRFKFGYAVMPNTFIGPEFMALGNEFYSEYRFGGHITGLRLDRVSFGLSGGVLSNSVTGSGGYGVVDAHIIF